MKLSGRIILLFAVVSLSGQMSRAYAMRQDPVTQDTTKRNPADTLKKGPVETLEFRSDSTVIDRVTNIAYLNGNARLIYQDFELDADYIRYDINNKTIFARGSKDARGRYLGRPIFRSKLNGTGTTDSLSYNTESFKLLIWGLYTEQEGGYFSGGKTKKQPDDELHISHVDYSTCNLEHPHFSLHITKGIATQKNIITSWIYLKAEDVPLPIGLPFAFIPKPNKKASGFIIGTPREDPTRGFMLENFGYYLGFNDYWDGRFMGTITTRGSWNASLVSNYTKRYKFNGNIALDYASTRLGLEGTPAYKPRKDYSIRWTHSQAANARPGTTFSASVQAQTSSYNAVTAAGYSYAIDQISRNALSSSINYGKTFADGLFNMNAALRHSQETEQKTVSLSLPEVSLNMSTISPFANKKNLGEPKWYEKLTVGYSLQTRNTINTFDSLLFKKETLRKFQNGFQHNIPLALSFNLFQYLNFNTSVNYNERWYFQTINKRYFRTATGPIALVDTIAGFKRGGDYTLSAGMSTKLYSKVLTFKKLGNIKALRHVMTPNVSFAYNPDFTDPRYGIYRNAVYADGAPVLDSYTGQPLKYSTFEQGIYGGPSATKSAGIGFGIENTVEIKVADKNDTTGTGEKRIPIIQGLSISGFYNFVAPTRKLSNLNFSGRSQLSDKLGFNFNGEFNPYQVAAVTDANGVTTFQEINRYTFRDGRLPRLTRFGLSFDYSFNPESLKSRNNNMDEMRQQTIARGATPEQADQLAMISRDPNAFVDFKMPWNFAFSYALQYANPLGIKSDLTNTLNFNGDVNITPKWKVQFNSGYDFKAKNLSYTSLQIYRDLHCWDLSFQWVPFGFYQSYSVDLRVRASVLQDLKLTKRKAFDTRY